MARRPRLNLPHIPQHVVQRGNNRLYQGVRVVEIAELR